MRLIGAGARRTVGIRVFCSTRSQGASQIRGGGVGDMTDKFEIYDIYRSDRSGRAARLCPSPILPGNHSPVAVLRFPEAFTVNALTALAVLIGHVVQAIASVCEKSMYWSWGGRPSDRVFTSGLGDRYLPLDGATRIRNKLLKACPGASDR